MDRVNNTPIEEGQMGSHEINNGAGKQKHIQWWKDELTDVCRDALIHSLYVSACAILEENRKNDTGIKKKNTPALSGTTEKKIENTVDQRQTIERLTSILQSGEGQWRAHFVESQHTHAQSIQEARVVSTELRRDNRELRDELQRLRAESRQVAVTEANSSTRGSCYEDEMEKLISTAFPEAVYTNCARTPHSGDAVLFAPEYGLHRCMLEYKSHSKAVGDADVIKLARDLDGSSSSFAIMLTRTANVTGRRDFDLERTSGGKPMLFIVRTDTCRQGLGSMVKLALRFLVRLVEANEDGAAGNGADPAQVVQQFGRIYRRTRRQMAAFDRQWQKMRKSLVDGLLELKDVFAPDITHDGVEAVLRKFSSSIDTQSVPVDRVLKSLRHRYPQTTKRKLTAMLRKQTDVCTIRSVKPGTNAWTNLVGTEAALNAKVQTLVCFKYPGAKRLKPSDEPTMP